MEVVLLVGGAALGAAFGELLKFAMEARASCAHFRNTLDSLIETLLSLDPKIQVMVQQNRQLNRPEEELKKLINIMGDGKQLVLHCSQINKFNLVAKASHEKDLKELIKSLQTFISNDMQVQESRDVKDILLGVQIILSRMAEKDAREQEDPLMLWLSRIGNSYTNLSAQNPTNGIDANEATHKEKVFSFRGFLSVTVISAENLPAKDLNGKSDPFVVLTLKKATSKVEITYKTKVVHKCLDPVWNQTFVFDVEDGLNDELVVEVWDKDTIKKDDLMGVCEFLLEGVKKNDENKKNIKLVGAPSSYLNLQLKWMPQSISCHSNFLQSLSTGDLKLNPVGSTLKVKLLQAKELPCSYAFIKSDPFAELHIQASGDKVEKSETIKKDLNPIWNQNFEFSVEDVSTKHLIVEVYDSGKLKPPKLIGRANIRLSDLQPGKVKYVWAKLEHVETTKDNKNRKQVHMELLYCSFENVEGSANGTEANGSENAVTQRGKEVIIRGFFSVTVIRHEGILALDVMRKSCALFCLTLRKAKSKEEIRNEAKVVKWSTDSARDCTFVFDVEDGLNDVVILEVSEKDKTGRCILSLTKVILEGEYTDNFELVGAKSGSLELHLKWNPK